jgi:hypothetical protein
VIIIWMKSLEFSERLLGLFTVLGNWVPLAVLVKGVVVMPMLSAAGDGTVQKSNAVTLAVHNSARRRRKSGAKCDR